MTPVDYALGGVGALSSLIGTGMSNSTNKKIARENRAWSEAMWDKQSAWQEQMVGQQQDWQEMMWNKENEYNTASAQIQRLIDVGINPNNAAGLVSNGAAGMPSAPSVPMAASMPTQNPIPSQPYDISGGLRLAADMSMMEKQKEKIGSDIQLNDATIKDILEGKLPQEKADTLLKMSQKELNEAIESGVTIDNIYKAAEKNASLDKIYADINKIAHETYGVHLSNETALYTLQHLLPLQKQAYQYQIKQAIAIIVEKYAAAQEHRENAYRAHEQGNVAHVQFVQLSAETGAQLEEFKNRKLIAQQTYREIQKFGIPINETGFDNLTKLVLHVQNAEGCSLEEAGKKVTDMLDASTAWTGYYVYQDIVTKFGSGQARNFDIPYGVGVLSRNKNNHNRNNNNQDYSGDNKQGHSGGDWNPHSNKVEFDDYRYYRNAGY